MQLVDIQSPDELGVYVHNELCRKENLLAEMFTTRTCVLRRGGEVCGLQFALQGPRCVKLTAVWAADQNVVYFYDTRGQRYLKEKLAKRLVFDTGESSAA